MYGTNEQPRATEGEITIYSYNMKLFYLRLIVKRWGVKFNVLRDT